MSQPVDFESISAHALREHLLANGARFDQPLLMSFDCDDTIVDRSQGPHYIAPSVAEMFHQLRNHRHVKTAINTGRDALSYQPVGRQIGPVDACLFVAGRVMRISEKTTILPHSSLLARLRERAWYLLQTEIAPYVEVRTSHSSYFISNRIEGVEKYMGHDRPPDWFDQIERHIIYTDDEQNARRLITSDDVVRLDVALFRDKHVKLVEAIEKKQLSLAKNELQELFPDLNHVTCSPILPSPQQATEIDAVGALCLFSDSGLSNKGKGLQILASNFKIPDHNIFSFGDSSSTDASDLAVADYLSNSHLFIASNGDERAKKQADFIIASIGQKGVVKAVTEILRLWN